MDSKDDLTPDWVRRDRILFGSLLGFCCVCVLQGLGVQGPHPWLQGQLFCHTVAVPFLAFRFVRLMRQSTRIRPKTGTEWCLEILAACLAVGGFGCILTHLNGYAGLLFAVLSLGCVAVAIRG